MIEAELIEFLINMILPSRRRKKKRAEDWYGVVEEKGMKSDYSIAKYRCFVVFRTEDGRTIKMKLTEENFNKYEQGRRYHKRRGEDFPEPAS
jgi:hypothetical protein